MLISYHEVCCLLFVFLVCSLRGGPEGTWRWKIHICMGRAARGIEVEIYFYRGQTGSRHGGGRGYFFGHFLSLESRTFM